MTVIYIPGLDGTGRLLYRQHALKQQHEVLCQSYPQDRPQTYEELADDAAKRLDEHGVKQAIVLAESFGGAVALQLTLRRPDLVERLVLINTFAYYPRRLRIRLANWLGAQAPSRPSPPTSRRLRGWFFFHRGIDGAVQNEWWDCTANVPMRAFGYRLQLIAQLDLRSRLKEIDKPALVFAAPDDKIVAVRAGRDLARELPNARLIEKRVGHAALVHPEVDIAAFLADPSLWPEAPPPSPVSSAATDDRAESAEAAEPPG